MSKSVAFALSCLFSILASFNKKTAKIQYLLGAFHFQAACNLLNKKVAGDLGLRDFMVGMEAFGLPEEDIALFAKVFVCTSPRELLAMFNDVSDAGERTMNRLLDIASGKDDDETPSHSVADHIAIALATEVERGEIEFLEQGDCDLAHAARAFLLRLKGNWLNGRPLST
jgi:hypothetical protein